MKKMNLKSLAALFLIFSAGVVTSLAEAQSYGNNPTRAVVRRPTTTGAYRNELMTILTGGGYTSGKLCKSCSSGSVLDVGVSYLYTMEGNLQLGGEGRLRSLSKEYSGTGKTSTRIDLIGVGVYNFDRNFQNAIFAKGGIGFYSMLKDDLSDYENKLGLFVGGGKRFPLFQSVTYTPELRLTKRGDLDFSIDLTLLNFSIVW